LQLAEVLDYLKGSAFMDKAKFDKYLKRVYSRCMQNRRHQTSTFRSSSNLLLSSSQDGTEEGCEDFSDIGCGQGTFIQEMDERGYKEVARSDHEPKT